MTGKDNRTVMIPVQVTDLPAVAHAFCIQAATCLGNPGAVEKFRAYQKYVEAMIPEGAKIFSPEAWSQIGIELLNAKNVSVHFQDRMWSREGMTGDVVISIDGKSQKSDAWDILRNDGRVDAVVALLKDLAPFECEVVLAPDRPREEPKPAPSPDPAPVNPGSSGRFWNP